MEEKVQEITVEVSRFQQYINDLLPDIVSFCLKIVLAAVVFCVGRKIIAWLLKALRRSLERAHADTGVIQFVSSLSKILLYAVLTLGIAANFGVTASSVAALLGTVGVTVGLALQGGLANLAGGVILLVFKPFQVGDYIIQDSQNGCEGTVHKIEICYTTLLSTDNKQILIPNGTLSNSTIINVTARDQRRLLFRVGISYDADLRLAKEILERILKEEPETDKDRDMLVYVDELGENAVILGLQAWVPTGSYFPIRWRLNERIKEEFDAHGIVIPYRQLDVTVHPQRDPRHSDAEPL